MDHASTQYVDIFGTAAGDFYPPSDYKGLAHAAGVDLSLYVPVGVKLWGTPPKIVSLLAIEKHGADTENFEGLQRFIRESPNSIRLKEFPLQEEAEIEAHFKQFSAILTAKGIDLSEVEISN